jgi:hypothetical protein
MSLFKDSPVKIAIAIVLVGVWGVLKYQRMHEYDDPIRPVQAPQAAPAPAEPPKLVVGAEASVIATIDWADPADPRAVPLWSGDYLFDTRAGIQVWNSGTLALTPLKALPASARLLEQAWMRYSGPKARGTLFAVQDAALASVVLVKDQQSTVDQRLLLPVGFTPDAMVKLTDHTALLCSAGARHALVVDGRTGELKLMTRADSPDQTLPITERGVALVGPVSGFPDQQAAPLADDGKIRQPLWFDTRSCRWQANGLPEPLASAQDLVLSVRPDVRLDNAGIAIVAASWRDPLTRELKTLQTPLVWNRDHLQWWQRKTADLPGVGPGAMVGLQELDWSYAAAEGRLAFHGSVDDQWREATQRLPAHDSFKLLYSGNEGVFVLLASKLQPGRIVHLDPASRFSALRTSLSGESVVAFGRGALMVFDSAGAKVNVITPDAPKPAPVAALPQAQRNSAGVELADGSILVFGGLAPGCDPTGPSMCPQRSAGALRWIPLEQRWQSVPGLAVPYASGEALEGGSTELSMHHGRSDFLVRGQELFYLSNNAIKWTGYPRDEAARLYRWQLAGNSAALAQTRLNRRNASLIALDDGRLVVAGGAAVDEGTSPACTSCLERRKEAVRRLAANRSSDSVNSDDALVRAEAEVPPCAACATTMGGDAYASARSCEIYDAAGNRWLPGPWANHAGGRAVKLDNGRIFKLGLLGESPQSAAYGAETADQALSHWSAAPPFPLPQSATVKAMHVIGNQVLLVMQTPADRMVLWDDDSRSWQIRPLPRHSAWSIHTLPEFVARGAGGGLLLIFQDGFEYLDWPLH